jgi:NAD(P)-dependent dehydrogenase (short-subunit alcohol dehydrogenase family)
VSELFNIKDKVAVVTGGTGVLGGAMVRGLSAHGCKVGIASRTREKAAKFVEEIEAAGGEAIPLQMDVTQKDSVEAAAAEVMEKWGRVDILVNSAGGNNPKATVTEDLSFFDMPAEALKDVIDLNLIGTLLPCQVFGLHMTNQNEGSIINISSMAAFRPLTKVITYSASKASIDNITYWLAVHMATKYSSSIRVNAIAPGFFLTDQNRFLLTDKETGELTPRGQTIISQTPMDRFGKPDELVSTLIWLISPGASFVTGTVIPVDGGFSAFAGV